MRFHALALFLASASATPIAQAVAGTAQACPATVDTSDVIPYTMATVSQKEPTKWFGTSNKAAITPGDMCTWFAFNTAASPTNTYCVLTFMFPQQEQASAAFNYSGPGNFHVDAMYYTSEDNDITPRMTWNTQPHGGTYQDAVQKYENVILPNGIAALSTGPCTRSSSALQLFVRVCSSDTTFTFTQDTNMCPMGLYLLVFPKKTGTTPASPSQTGTVAWTGGVGR